MLLAQPQSFINKNGMSQKETAALLGTHQPYVSLIMRNRVDVIGIENIIKMLFRVGIEVNVTAK